MAQGKSQDIGVSFARDLGLFDACMIGIGAMIGAGIFVLTGIAAGVAGPGAIAAFALNGVVTLLTALSYAELASAFPESGGGYSYIKKAFPGAVGFASGWMLWFSYIVACSLYAMGFGSYFWELIKKYLAPLHDAAAASVGETLPILVVTFLIGLVFIGINIHGTAVTGKVENFLTISKILVLAVFILYGLDRIFGDPGRAATSFTPFLPNGFGAVILAMGLTFIASQEGIFSSVLFGEIPEKVARYSRTPVMIVKRYEGTVKSLVKKVIG